MYIYIYEFLHSSVVGEKVVGRPINTTTYNVSLDIFKDEHQAFSLSLFSWKNPEANFCCFC
jgi:hypothetical protein